jgi:hypothetical protein
VYQVWVLPTAPVEFNCEVAPAQIVAGVAVTGLGAAAIGLTVTVTGVRVGEGQLGGGTFHVRIT